LGSSEKPWTVSTIGLNDVETLQRNGMKKSAATVNITV